MTTLKLNPSKTALINVDMQAAFVENSPLAAPNGAALVPVINKIAAACRETGALVIHTLIKSRPDGSNNGRMAEKFEAVRAGYIREGNPSSDLDSRIEVGEGDVLLNKPRYGAFTGTDLDQILRVHGIDTVIVTGICTNICCESTAREAGMLDYNVVFPSDGSETFPIGDVTVEELKRATLATLQVAFASTPTVDEAIAALRQGATEQASKIAAE